MNKKNLFKIVVHLFLLLFIINICIGQEKSNDERLMQLGENNYKSGDFEKAIEVFNEIINISVDNRILSQANIYLAYTYYTLSENKEVKKYIEEVLKLNAGFIVDENEFAPGFVEFFEDTKKSLTGISFIETIPTNANIYINNKERGYTPIKEELLSGKYALRVVKWGYSPIEDEFEVAPKTIVNLKYDFNYTKNWKDFAKSSLVMVVLTIVLGKL